MPDENQQPDPSALTTQVIWREVAALKELVFSKIDAIGKAIDVAHADLVRVPTNVQEAVETLKELHEEHFKRVDEQFKTVDVRFDGVKTQFDERDIRTQQDKESATTAVNAALSAQKELSGKQAESFSDATNKSEQQFTKQIDLQGELLRTEVKGLVTQIDELKERFNRGEGKGEGVEKSKENSQTILGIYIAAAGLLIAVAGVVIAVMLRR